MLDDRLTEDEKLVIEGVKALRALKHLPDMLEACKKNNEAIIMLVEEVVKIREILGEAANGV